LEIISLLTKFIFFVNFILKFFLENTYKFCYEKKLQEIAVNFFFFKIFV